MKRQFKKIMLLLLCVLILTGCWDQRLFEQVGLLLVVGVEESDDGKLRSSLAYPVIGGKGEGSVDIIVEDVNLLRDSRKKGRQSSPKYIEAGKVQQILISDSLAQKGIHDIIEVYQRDATSPAVAYVVIVEGSPHELLEKASKFEDKPRIGFYIYQLLENNSKNSNIPNTKVFDFDINFFAPGVDPITPLLKLEENDIRLTGSALFYEDRMVGKLDNDQTIMLLGLMGQAKYTNFVIDDPKLVSDNPDKYGISVVLRKPKRKININFDSEGKPVIKVSLRYECILDEYKWNKTNKPEEQEMLEKSIKTHIEKICNETISKLQEVNSDPIGFGNLIRAKHYEYWKSIDWKEIYIQANISADVKVEIVKEGIIK